MAEKQSIHTITKFGILFFSFAIVACTTILDFPSIVVEYPASQKFNLTVHLRITQQLLEAKWTDGLGNENVVLLGEPFSQNAEHLTRLLFAEVIVSRPTDSRTDLTVDAILTPKLVSLKKSRPSLGGFDMQTTVVVEWRLTDLGHNIIWVESITSKVFSPLGTLGSVDSSDRKHVTLLLNDLFKKSFNAMSSSPEIREFSQSRQRHPS